eukprot:scaffold8477_cov286-Pinguiococcus_pyrenoidosus.AAC.1
MSLPTHPSRSVPISHRESGGGARCAQGLRGERRPPARDPRGRAAGETAKGSRAASGAVQLFTAAGQPGGTRRNRSERGTAERSGDAKDHAGRPAIPPQAAGSSPGPPTSLPRSGAQAASLPEEHRRSAAPVCARWRAARIISSIRGRGQSAGNQLGTRGVANSNAKIVEWV